MKKERGLLGKLFNGILSILLAVTILPAVATTLEAADENINGSYVSLPITIRDYASDGMLFEFNEYGVKNDVNVASGEEQSFYKFYTEYTSTSASENDYKGIRITTDTTPYKMTWWHYILCNSDGSIAKVSANGEDKSGMVGTDGQFFVLVWGTDTTNHNILSKITESNKANYRITYDTNANTFIIYNNNNISGSYHLADTKGFGLLQTNANDIVNNLSGDATIDGTVKFENGTWGITSDPDPITTTLNSGAMQYVNGAFIRTNLVEGKLGENGKPQYTPATVKYLAEYMQQVMKTEFTDGNGNYYTYAAIGAKLDELGGTDLASKIRAQLNNNNFALGEYTLSKTKFDNGNLSHYSQIANCYDAAYFLLHNLYFDNTGYGKTASEYNIMHLVEKTDSTGTYYVFNSGYDNTAYDTANKSIYNTQTDTMTIRGSDNEGVLDPDKPQYVRGNALPLNRFNPLYNLGYGNATSSDTYRPYYDAAGAVGTGIKAETFLYNETNYHMSLEGHAKFIYYYDSNMYFTFTGDDDVYLYINGTRVLDLGAAHSISKATININDVAKLCGLKDGEAYDFDFYYMERHGTAANFGIKTNIKIVDPSMLTTKKGYQNGGEVGYNGYVNPQQPVTYEFGLQNNGESDITNLVFDDPILGVNLSKDAITLNSDTAISDLIVTKYNTNGTVAYARNMGSADELKAILADVLKVGERIVIYGIKYTIPTDKWVNNAFPNTVHTKATPTGDNTTTRELNGIADYVVQKQEYSFESLHYYDWGAIDTDKTPYGTFVGTSKGVTATKDELLSPVDKLVNFVTDTQTIQLCSASGNTTNNINPNVTLNADGSITYTGTETGADSFYYLVKDNGDTYGPVRVDVYVYGVADNIFVLDYGLMVDLNESETSFMMNDVVSLATANPYGTEFGIVNVDASADAVKYGEFRFTNPSLKYIPQRIMNDDDTIKVTISVIEVGKTEVTKTTGVTMTQEVKVAPASVMYYEDNFEGLTYVGEDGNQWLLYEAVDENGNVVVGTEQSADQNSNYGSDPNYDPDKQGTLKLNVEGLTADEIAAAQASLAGDASNGTVSALKVNKTAEILNFEFDGTGFEILSRTTSEDYAVLNVTVTNTVTGEVVYDFPVITECINGDLYQVPVIAATNMPYGTYEVSLKAARSKNKVRMVYIDGVRIYGALAGKTIQLDASTTVSKEDAYYSDDEKDAYITEIKRLIKDNKIAYAYVGLDETDLPSLVTGTTLVEERKDTGLILTPAVDLNEYLTYGPNNEIYMDSDMSSVIAFYLTPDENVAKENRTVQIGAHRKSDAVTFSSSLVNLVYADTAEVILYEPLSYNIASGTEQYYTVDMSKLTPDANGRYLVMIGSTYGENDVNTLALTNIKLAGYTLSAIESEMIKTVETQDLSFSPMMLQMSTFRMLRRAPEVEEPEVETPVTPEVNVPVKPEVDSEIKDTIVDKVEDTTIVTKPSEEVIEKVEDEVKKEETVTKDETEKEESEEVSAVGVNNGGLIAIVSFIAVMIVFLGAIVLKKKKEN